MRFVLHLAIGLAALAGCPSAHAIILYGKDNSANQSAPTASDVGYAGLPWDNVVRVGTATSGTIPNRTGVYLGDNFVLTAHHFWNTPPQVIIGGSTYLPDNSYVPQQIFSGTNGVDLVVFKIENGPMSLPAITLYEGNLEGRPGVVVGWGQGKGTELVGQGWNWGGDATDAKRWGTNQPEFATNISYSAGASAYDYTAIGTYFNAGASADEAALALRDSGTPMFQYIDGQWQLVGIGTYTEGSNSSYYDRDAGAPVDPDYNLFVRVSTYAQAIKDIIAPVPEPSSAALLMAGALWLCGRRRRENAETLKR